MVFSVTLAGGTYDLKRFLRDHPGGVNTLKHYEGKAVKDAMQKTGHSTSAYHMLNDFKVLSSVSYDNNLTGDISVNGRLITKEEDKKKVEEIAFLEELEFRSSRGRGHTAMEFPVTLAGGTYDLKQFLRDHPGGVNTLKHYEGKSVKEAMKKFGHSTSAYHILNDFKVTSLVSNDNNLTGDISANGRLITKEEDKKNVEEIAFLEELEKKLDWSKPLVSQLERIAPHYSVWVNSSVYRRCRLFANPVLESISFTPWYLVPVVWVPVILYLGYKAFMEQVACGDSCTNEPMSSWTFAYHVLAGVLIWTTLEYSLHRWVFHLDPGNNLTMIKIHFLIHGLHHKTPFDGLRQVFPPVPAAVLTYILYEILACIVSHPDIKLVGGLAGYLTYDMIHFYVHHGSPKDGTYLYAMKRYHSNHHFVNHDKAFGISSKIWDYVFRTFVNVRQLGFSLQW